MTTSRSPRVAQLLTALAIRRPWALVIAAGLAAMLSLWVAATRLEFRFGHTDLVSASDRYRQLDERDRLEFEEVPGRVVVVVRANDPEQAKAFAAALAAKWADDPKIERVLHRIDLAPLKAKALWYLSPADLAALHERLAAHQERLHTLAGASTLDDLLARLNREVTSALIGRVFTGFLDDDEKEQQAPPDLTLVLSLLREMNRWLDGTRTYQSPWMAALGGTTPFPSPDGFLWSDDQRLLFVLANPRRDTTEFNRFATAVEGIRADVRDLQRRYPGIEVGLTGRAVIEADEMGVAQRDMALATIVAVLGVAGLFVAFFRGFVRPALATITLILGVCWSLGVTTLTIGHLNILTIVFMPMLVGLGDHSIHFIARFEEERRAGRSLREALERTLAGTGMGIVAATGTTALAFAMLLLTGFKGLMELGVISASGILLTAGATLTVLPALLVLGERWRPAPERQPASRARTAGPGWLLRHPQATLAASGLLVALSLVGLRGVRFDGSLLQLQTQTEAIVWAQRVAEHTKRSVLFDELVASSLEEVRTKVAALQTLPSVAEVDSIVSVLPDSPTQKRDLIRELRPLVATLPVPVATPGTVDLPALRSALERIRFKMVEGDATGLSPAEERSRRERSEARDLIDKALGTTGRMEADAVREALARFQSELFQDLAETLRTLKQQPDGDPVSIEDLPPEVRARYVGRSGQYRLFVYPAENVWEFGPLTRFVADVQSVDPDARGTTATTFEYLRVLKEGYTRAAVYAVVAVAVLALLVFRAVVPGLLALVPLTLGATWTLGVMGWLGVPLNAANLLLLPLIVGVGIDNGVYLVHRFRETPDGPDEPPPLAPSAAKAITLASLTNIVGFGSLMLSSHRGIFSLGLVVAVGVVCLWIASVTTLPSLLALLGKRRRADRVPHQALSLVPVPAVPREAWAGHTAAVRNRPGDAHGAIKGGTA
jgi:hopanoid biosynthesis associated RND transporter like protein HpnN